MSVVSVTEMISTYEALHILKQRLGLRKIVSSYAPYCLSKMQKFLSYGTMRNPLEVLISRKAMSSYDVSSSWILFIVQGHMNQTWTQLSEFRHYGHLRMSCIDQSSANNCRSCFVAFDSFQFRSFRPISRIGASNGNLKHPDHWQRSLDNPGFLF